MLTNMVYLIKSHTGGFHIRTVIVCSTYEIAVAWVNRFRKNAKRYENDITQYYITEEPLVDFEPIK